VTKTIDQLDLKILHVLKANSKSSMNQISKKLLIPITTAHNRIKKLEKTGIIKNYTIILNNKKLGKDLCAFILIKIDYTALKSKNLSQQEVAMRLKSREEVEDAALITGLKDIILKIRAHNIDELNNFITKDLRNFAGVKSTETMIVLDELN